MLCDFVELLFGYLDCRLGRAAALDSLVLGDNHVTDYGVLKDWHLRGELDIGQRTSTFSIDIDYHFIIYFS